MVKQTKSGKRITSPTQPGIKPVAPTKLPEQASARAKQVQAAHAAGVSPRKTPNMGMTGAEAFAKVKAAGAARKKK